MLYDGKKLKWRRRLMMLKPWVKLKGINFWEQEFQIADIFVCFYMFFRKGRQTFVVVITWFWGIFGINRPEFYFRSYKIARTKWGQFVNFWNKTRVYFPKYPEKPCNSVLIILTYHCCTILYYSISFFLSTFESINHISCFKNMSLGK